MPAADTNEQSESNSEEDDDDEDDDDDDDGDEDSDNSQQVDATSNKDPMILESCTPVPPAPTPATTNNKDALQLTKINLKQFVERWNSHPNSPFMYDSPRKTTISLLTASTSGIRSSTLASRTSLTGWSPSPTSSVSTPSSLCSSPTHWNDSDCFYHYSIDTTETDVNENNNDESENNKVNNNGDAPILVNKLIEGVKGSDGGGVGVGVGGVDKAKSHTDEVDNVKKKKHMNRDNMESVESAIERTTALLKSVKETLIQQMESGTAVRDRTGARIWERRGSGVAQCASPGAPQTAAAAAKAKIVSQSSFEIKSDNNVIKMISTGESSILQDNHKTVARAEPKPELKPVARPELKTVAKPVAKPHPMSTLKTTPRPAQKTAPKPAPKPEFKLSARPAPKAVVIQDPAKSSVHQVRDDWQYHAPVSAKRMGVCQVLNHNACDTVTTRKSSLSSTESTTMATTTTTTTLVLTSEFDEGHKRISTHFSSTNSTVVKMDSQS